MPKPFEGAWKKKKTVFLTLVVCLAFWFVAFYYQYLTQADTQISLIKSSAFAGAILMGLSLLVGPMALVFRKLNFVKYRRDLGVIGFSISFLHFVFVMLFYYSLNFTQIFTSTDIFTNNLFVGLIALVLFIPAFLTSMDWVMGKIGFKKWKALQRLVYVAWILTVVHFIQKPGEMMTPFGYILLVVTALVFVFELAAFSKKLKRSTGTFIGVVLIVVAAALIYLEYSTGRRNIMNLITLLFEFFTAGLVIVIVAKAVHKLKKKAPAPETVPEEVPKP
jgi:DMSO/TMAO reductase YedYZ heme-binding membrane subunit